MRNYINEYGKECFDEVTQDTPFNAKMFTKVKDTFDDDRQVALHTNLGSITVLDRMTGFGHRDIETGFSSPEGKFWLASGNMDVRRSGCKTIQEAIDWIKKNANNCVGV